MPGPGWEWEAAAIIGQRLKEEVGGTQGAGCWALGTHEGDRNCREGGREAVSPRHTVRLGTGAAKRSVRGRCMAQVARV